MEASEVILREDGVVGERRTFHTKFIHRWEEYRKQGVDKREGVNDSLVGLEHAKAC